jgi:hypothetical protein
MIYSVRVLLNKVLFMYGNYFLTGERQQEIREEGESSSEFYGPLWE